MKILIHIELVYTGEFGFIKKHLNMSLAIPLLNTFTKLLNLTNSIGIVILGVKLKLMSL